MRLKYMFKDCLELRVQLQRQWFNGRWSTGKFLMVNSIMISFPATQRISMLFPPLNNMLLANTRHDSNQEFVGTRR